MTSSSTYHQKLENPRRRGIRVCRSRTKSNLIGSAVVTEAALPVPPPEMVGMPKSSWSATRLRDRCSVHHRKHRTVTGSETVNANRALANARNSVK